MNIYEGRCDRRVYLILPRSVYSIDKAIKYATVYWHCSRYDVAVSGADQITKDKFYVELPSNEGDYYAIYRLKKTSEGYFETMRKNHFIV